MHEASIVEKKEQLQARQALEQELGGVREQLLASQQEAERYRVEAQTVQRLVDRLAATASREAKIDGAATGETFDAKKSLRDSALGHFLEEAI